MKQFFPEDVKFISLLRHPIKQIESTFHYQEYDKLFLRHGFNRTSNKTSVFEDFFKSPMYHFRKALPLEESLPLLHNGMFFDLGYNFYNRTMSSEENDEIYKAIEEVDRDIDLMLIVEHIDESLVLMMREFCWTFEDIIYIKHNQRMHKKDHVVKSTSIRRQILKWNHADLLLYEHFNRTLWKRIEKHGPEFLDDLRFFKAKLKNFKMRCAFQGASVKTAEKSVKVSSHKTGGRVSAFDKPLCERVSLSEIDYIKRFRKSNVFEKLKKRRERRILAVHQKRLRYSEENLKKKPSSA